MVKCYRASGSGEILVSDGCDLLLDLDGARELGQELIDAADRADRGELDRWNAAMNIWERVQETPA